MSETNKAVIRSFVDSVNSQNWDRLRILLVPNFIRHGNAAGAAAVRSAEELITYLKGEYVTFPDPEETLLDLVAEGESVAVRSNFRGTQVGSMGSYPPSNKVLSATYLAIYRLERGRIAEAWVEWDNIMGSNNWAITMQPNLRRKEFSPVGRGRLFVDVLSHQFSGPSPDQPV